MRYLGSLGSVALSPQGHAAVGAFEQTYSQLEPAAQSRIYEIAKEYGGGEEAARLDMLKIGAVGAVVGGALGFLVARRKRR